MFPEITHFSLSFQLAYNTEGEMMIPLVIHKHGQIPDVLLKHFKGKINFFPTEDGKIDRNIMSIQLHLIKL